MRQRRHEPHEAHGSPDHAPQRPLAVGPRLELQDVRARAYKRHKHVFASAACERVLQHAVEELPREHGRAREVHVHEHAAKRETRAHDLLHYAHHRAGLRRGHGVDACGKRTEGRARNDIDWDPELLHSLDDAEVDISSRAAATEAEPNALPHQEARTAAPVRTLAHPHVGPAPRPWPLDEVVPGRAKSPSASAEEARMEMRDEPSEARPPQV
mmetsp:Transcript_71715/g.198977  ORF Transcript_71715/g.198977 Transcript_71715/m.198977 type:complete len:213 (+) Transcript_71715:666-1304(+)